MGEVELPRCQAKLITRGLGRASLWIRDRQCPRESVLPVNGHWCCPVHYLAATEGPRARGDARPVEFVREL